MCTDTFYHFMDALKGLGFYEKYRDIFDEWKFDEGILEGIRLGIPDASVEKMLRLLKAKDYENAASAYHDFKKRGLLRVKPAIVGNDDSIPSLMLAIDEYLHWFRGYYFQISDTSSGIGCVYHGADRLDSAYHSIAYIKGEDEARRFVFVACFLPVLCYHDSGRKLLREDTELVNQFLFESGKRNYMGDVSLADFFKCVTAEEYSVKLNLCDYLSGGTTILKEMRIVCDGYSYGLLQICSDRIRFFTHKRNDKYALTTLELPTWLTDDECDEDYSSVMNKVGIYHIAIRALMTICSFRADWMCMYPIGVKRGDMLRLDYNVQDSAEAWKDVDAALKEVLGE